MRIVNGITIRDIRHEWVSPPVAVVVIDVRNEKYRAEALLGTAHRFPVPAAGGRSFASAEPRIAITTLRSWEDLAFGPSRELHEASRRFMRARYVAAPASGVLDAWERA